MSNFIQYININNFKSIQDCAITDCKRINLFIGKPNVGKSNIIEALSMFSIPYLKENSSKKLFNLIRLENETELFYNGNTDKKTSITTNTCDCNIRYDVKEGLYIKLNYYYDIVMELLIDNGFTVKKMRNYQPAIKRYNFKEDVFYKKSHAKYLIPPYGINLLSVIENYKELKEEVIRLFKEYGLGIVFDRASQTIKVIQSTNGSVFLIPYNSVADTLQRIIFFKTAIASNSSSVLLFEEPEAHAFPPYMSLITQEMIYKKDNQYFIATHSPFILNDLLENARQELAVFMVYYEDYETRLRQLGEKELYEAYQHGVDFFTNSESFVE